MLVCRLDLSAARIKLHYAWHLLSMENGSHGTGTDSTEEIKDDKQSEVVVGSLFSKSANLAKSYVKQARGPVLDRKNGESQGGSLLRAELR